MWQTLQAAVLGVVQGLTEFLPVSSTAHLIAVPYLLDWKTPGLVFDTSLHLGTLAAVLYYFRQDLWVLSNAWLKSIKTRDLSPEQTQESKLAWLLLLAVVPAGIAGVVLEKVVEHYFRSPLVIVFALIVGGGLLFLADRLLRRQEYPKDLFHVNLKTAMAIGFSQIVALIPGISRSGITMTAALFCGLSRTAAARFSFLLGIPIIAAGGIFKLKDLLGTTLTSSTLSYFGAGFVTATLSGYLCIRFLMKYLQNHSFTIFAIYRIALAVLIFAFATLKGDLHG